MTTDITKLAQREKFEAWVITQICISKITLEGLRTPDGYRNSMLSGRDYNLMWNLWKAAGAELVEALESEKRICATWRKTAEANSEKLEKAQQTEKTLKSRNCRLEGIITAAENRISELGKTIAEQDKRLINYAEISTRNAERAAELESRTVKLPEPFKLAKSSSGLTYYYADEVDAALTAAGIKVEVE